MRRQSPAKREALPSLPEDFVNNNPVPPYLNAIKVKEILKNRLEPQLKRQWCIGLITGEYLEAV